MPLTPLELSMSSVRGEVALAPESIGQTSRESMGGQVSPIADCAHLAFGTQLIVDSANIAQHDTMVG